MQGVPHECEILTSMIGVWPTAQTAAGNRFLKFTMYWSGRNLSDTLKWQSRAQMITSFFWGGQCWPSREHFEVVYHGLPWFLSKRSLNQQRIQKKKLKHLQSSPSVFPPDVASQLPFVLDAPAEEAWDTYLGSGRTTCPWKVTDL